MSNHKLRIVVFYDKGSYFLLSICPGIANAQVQMWKYGETYGQYVNVNRRM